MHIPPDFTFFNMKNNKIYEEKNGVFTILRNHVARRRISRDKMYGCF